MFSTKIIRVSDLLGKIPWREGGRCRRLSLWNFVFMYSMSLQRNRCFGWKDGEREHAITRTKVCPFLAECGKTQGAYFVQSQKQKEASGLEFLSLTCWNLWNLCPDLELGHNALAVERFHVRSTGIAPLRLEFVGTLWLILSKWGLYFLGKHNFLMKI